MNQRTKEYRQQVTDSFIKCLEEKKYSWKKDWKVPNMQPQNAVTGANYNGINRLNLTLECALKEFTDPRFATFAQIKTKNWHLRKGAKGIKVEYWMPYDVVGRKAIAWDVYRMLPREKQAECIFTARYFTVFNAQDIEGIPELSQPQRKDIKPSEIIDTICKNMKIEIINDGGDNAFYKPSEDKIHMPEAAFFDSDYSYNATALHELAHATAAEHRLHLNMQGFSGEKEYAFEELIAEIASVFMAPNFSAVTNDYQMENHKAYIQDWITLLQKSPDVLIKAIREAGKVSDYLEMQAEIITRGEWNKRMAKVMEVADPEAAICVKPEEIVKEGFRPVKNLIDSMNQLNEEELRKISLKEISVRYKAKDKEANYSIIENIANICQEQEKARILEQELEIN